MQKKNYQKTWTIQSIESNFALQHMYWTEWLLQKASSITGKCSTYSGTVPISTNFILCRNLKFNSKFSGEGKNFVQQDNYLYVQCTIRIHTSILANRLQTL